jgi:hypothetical protein
VGRQLKQLRTTGKELILCKFAMAFSGCTAKDEHNFVDVNDTF